MRTTIGAATRNAIPSRSNLRLFFLSVRQIYRDLAADGVVSRIGLVATAISLHEFHRATKQAKHAFATRRTAEFGAIRYCYCAIVSAICEANMSRVS